MRARVLCSLRTDGYYNISGHGRGPDQIMENDPAAMEFQIRAMTELGGGPGIGFGVVIAPERLEEARRLARAVFGVDWDESSAADRKAVLGLFSGNGWPTE